jgi:hypothetical protein
MLLVDVVIGVGWEFGWMLVALDDSPFSRPRGLPKGHGGGWMLVWMVRRVVEGAGHFPTVPTPDSPDIGVIDL